MLSSPLYLAAALAAIVLAAELLVAHTRLRILGAALLVILLGAVASNLGAIPTAASTPLYDGVFTYLAPLSIFWLLLGVNLRHVLRAGAPMLACFALGSAGTVLGVTIGVALAGGSDAFGDQYAALGGMFAGTYTGGSINFNAVALEYGVVSDGGLYAGAVAVDNIVTALWMMTCLAAPRALSGLWPKTNAEILQSATAFAGDATPASADGDVSDVETFGPADLGLLLAMGMAAMLVRDIVVAGLDAAGVAVPGMLVLTALALIIAQLPIAGRLRGARALGMFSVYVFLTVIGALCSLEALANIGELGVRLAILAFTAVAVHGAVVFGGARLLKVDPVTASVASQANVGGGTTALALARSLGRPDLAVPGILVGSLGTAAGTFLGFWLASAL